MSRLKRAVSVLVLPFGAFVCRCGGAISNFLLKTEKLGLMIDDVFAQLWRLCHQSSPQHSTTPRGFQVNPPTDTASHHGAEPASSAPAAACGVGVGFTEPSNRWSIPRSEKFRPATVIASFTLSSGTPTLIMRVYFAYRSSSTAAPAAAVEACLDASAASSS